MGKLKKEEKQIKKKSSFFGKTFVVNASLITIIVVSVLLMVFYKRTMAVPDVPEVVTIHTIEQVRDPFQSTSTNIPIQAVTGSNTRMYSYNQSLKTMNQATSMTKSQDITDAGLVYLIEHGYPNDLPLDSVSQHENYIITQWAIWAYNSLYNNHLLPEGITIEKLSNNYGNYSNAFKRLLDGAKNARAHDAVSGTYDISFKNNFIISANNNQFETSWIGLNSAFAVGTYKAEITAPAGYYIILNDGTKIEGNKVAETTFNIQQTFKMVIPTNNLESNNLNINVKIKATFARKKLRYYSPTQQNQEIQNGLLSIVYTEDVQREVSTSVTIPTAKLKILKISTNEQGQQEQIKGAKLRLESSDDTNFKAITFETTGAPYEVNNLVPGKTYTVTEVEAAIGYVNKGTTKSYKVTAADSYTSGNTIASITLENDYTKVQVGKIDINTGNHIAGATMVIKDLQGNEKYRIITTTEPTLITKIPIGSYILEEVEAPTGYILSQTKIRFEVKNDGALQQVFNKNNYTTISVIDQKIHINLPTAGFEITIKNAKGKVVEKYITDGKLYITKKLSPGKYTIEETKAPTGYVCYPSPIDVYIPEEGSVKPNDIIFPNDYTKLKINKVDKTTQLALANAEIELKDEKGKVIDKWISTDTPHELEKIPVGKYTLEETKAPDGYALAKTPTIIEVKSTGEVQNFTMENEVEVIVPDTEVTASNITYICGGLIITCGISLIIFNIIRQKKKKL